MLDTAPKRTLNHSGARNNEPNNKKSSRTNEPTRDGEIHNERPNEMQGKQQQESLYEASALLI